MTCLMTMPTVVGLLTAAVALPAVASAGPKGSNYSCKRDRVVDAPMAFVFDTAKLTAAQLHASAYGGSDRSGSIKPTAWALYDATGQQLDVFPQSLLAWTSANMLKDVNLDGLVPGSTYTLALTSQDWCGNIGVLSQTITLPAGTGESDVPTVSEPRSVGVGLMGYSTTLISFDATDNTGVAKVTVLIDGTPVSSFTYANGRSVRWWFDEYDDGTQSTLEGPRYYITYPDSYRGAAHSVEVEVEDVYGNRAVSSAVIPL